ncbi:MAG TPA: HepT-like ribonuclease domain-containing protein [Acetobacteraceae bacterium]|nr:HepT-like ribonuclease domain-containing protein [Acetobacteraceae bacterium]
MPSSRPAIRFLDILDNIRLVQSYVQGIDRAAFESDRRTRDAVGRCLERGSEAATTLGVQADELAPGSAWHAVRAFGNVLRHAYDQVDRAQIWELVIRDLPDLAIAAEAALTSLDPGVDPEPSGAG